MVTVFFDFFDIREYPLLIINIASIFQLCWVPICMWLGGLERSGAHALCSWHGWPMGLVYTVKLQVRLLTQGGTTFPNCVMQVG